MPRSRGSEVAKRPPSPPPQQSQPPPPPPQQRQSPRAPLHQRTTNSDSDGGVHSRRRGSPGLDDGHRRRSPRSPLLEKKRTGRATDLETKLSHVQDELRKLREQLASAEAARRDAQHELDEAKKKLPPTTTTAAAAGERAEKDGEQLADQDEKLVDSADAASPASDEAVLGEEGNCADCVVVEAAAATGDTIGIVEDRDEEAPAASAVAGSEDEAQSEESPEKKTEEAASSVEAELAEKIKELERCLAENGSLKKQLAEAEASAAAARTREEETALKLVRAGGALAGSRAKEDRLAEQLEAAEGARSSLEAEMKKLKAQTEQWRKAADAAVAALSVAGGLGAAQCVSVDKHLRLAVGYAGDQLGGLGSPLMADDSEDGGWGGGGGRRKGAAGIRMLGELWKKKLGQQK